MEDEHETPTCLDWMPTSINNFVVSYARALLGIFDQQTGQVVHKMTLPTNQDITYIEQQANAIVAHPTMDMFITGHEDGTINLINSNSSIKTIDTQSGTGITALCLDQDGYTLYANDKVWDI